MIISLRLYSCILALKLGLILLLGLPALHPTHAQEFPLATPVGSHTIGLTTGPLFPIRVLSSQTSKLFGEALMPSWMITLTEPIGTGWYQGQLALGGELIVFHTYLSLSTYRLPPRPTLFPNTTLRQLL